MQELLMTTCEGVRIQIDPDRYEIDLPEGVDFE